MKTTYYKVQKDEHISLTVDPFGGYWLDFLDQKNMTRCHIGISEEQRTAVQLALANPVKGDYAEDCEPLDSPHWRYQA